MNIGSVEGLVLALLLVVPGGLGVLLRRSVYPAQAATPFVELLHSLGAVLAGLLFSEVAFAITDRNDRGVGDFLLEPLLATETFSDSVVWPAYALFGVVALFSPLLGAWVRRTPPARRVFGAASPHADGLDYVIHEVRPRLSRGEEIWATVNTVSGEALLGQLAWRSTAPDPLEVVLTRVRDLNDPTETEQQSDWYVSLRSDSIEAIWINVPEND